MTERMGPGPHRTRPARRIDWDHLMSIDPDTFDPNLLIRPFVDYYPTPVRAVQELRRSSAASPHRNRKRYHRPTANREATR